MNQILQTNEVNQQEKGKNKIFELGKNIGYGKGTAKFSSKSNSNFNPNPNGNSNVNSYANTTSGGSGKMSVKSIVKIFAIAIIIYGVCIIGNASYALAESARIKSQQKNPEVLVSREGNVLYVEVKSEKPLRSVGYAWNDEEPQFVSASNKTEFKTNIRVIDGDENKLTIVVLDATQSAKKTKYSEYYSKEPDTIKPKVVISNEDPKVKVTVTDDTELSYVTYKYGDGEEIEQSVNPLNPTSLVFYIDNIESTQKTLTVTAIDKSQNKTVIEQEIKGTTKPKITVTQIGERDGSKIIKITVTDEDKLQKVVIYRDEERYSTPDDVSIDKSKFTQKIAVEHDTVVKVEAYNVNEKMSTEKYTNF